MTISKHLNWGYDAGAPNGIPDGAGDRYYAQDLMRDLIYLIDRLGLAHKDIIHHVPFHIFGGAVWQGTGATFNITAGYGYVKKSFQTVLSYGSSPPTTQDEDAEAVRVAWPDQTDLTITGYTAGGATNYLKVSYKDTDGTTRARAKKAGTWAYEQSPDVEFSADTTPPTDYELCLCTFTEAAGTFTFSPYYYPENSLYTPTHRAGHVYPLRNILVSNWTERATPSVENMHGVCWSPELSLFCAVGANDGADSTIYTSPDGIIWTERPTPSVETMRGVCWSPELSLFCAVGDNDGVDSTIYTSPDGIAWTERSAPNTVRMFGVCWSPELSLFCAVGNSDGVDSTIYTSPDGITWTERSAPGIRDMYEVCWSPELNLFCAVGDADATDSTIYTSPDGISWKERVTSTTEDIMGVCWSPELSLFCAIGTVVIYTSPDGINWTNRSAPTAQDMRSVCWSPELSLFCAVGDDDGADSTIYTSMLAQIG